MNASHNLNVIFAWCNSKLEAEWPSWVPDWREPFERKHVQWLLAPGNSQYPSPLASFSSQNQKLTVRGVKVGRICPRNTRSTDSPKRKPSITWGENSCLKAKYTGINSDSLREALWKTLMLNHPRRERSTASILDIPWDCLPPTVKGSYSNGTAGEGSRSESPLTRESCRTFNEFREANKDLDVCGRPLRSFFPSAPERLPWLHWPVWLLWPARRLPHWSSSASAKNLRLTLLSLAGRRLFTTNSGFVGLAPEAAQSGDVIAVVWGCDFPIVLRPCGDEYRVLGECYVHGLMGGEVFDYEKAGKCTFEDITIC